MLSYDNSVRKKMLEKEATKKLLGVYSITTAHSIDRVRLTDR